MEGWKPENNKKKLDTGESRRDFLKKLGILATGVVASAIVGDRIISSLSGNSKEEEKENEDMEKDRDRKVIPWNEYKTLVPKLEFQYKDIVPELKIEGLEMIGEVGKYGADTVSGKILRTMRFQNITEAVESKYNLPKNIILAMVMEESTGADLLPNAKDDGGFGLCHMQGSIARSFSLHTYGDCSLQERTCCRITPYN